ncbi:MAG: hypothetical protein V2J89_10865 [Halieaceae bacterium]|jgi:hypothetical protein|nr:hypothetical protein [Halieaceae bacterium]
MIRELRTGLLKPLLIAVMLAWPGPDAMAATLKDALAGALARAQIEKPDVSDDSSSWLAGIPSLTASYIDSQESLGTDEAEVMLNLPIKSRSRRRLDNQLADISTRLEHAGNQYQRWLYSGLVRERAWAARLAQVELHAAEEKLATLSSLEQRSAQLSSSGALPAYASLIIQRELVSARMTLDAREADLETRLADYRALTGLNTLPADLSENNTVPGELVYAEHPAMRRLEQARAQEAALLALSAPDSASWNLALVARNFEGPTLEEEQYGMQIQMPLNFLGTKTTGNSSEIRSSRRDFMLARDELWLNLKQQWETTEVQARHLHSRMTLLNQAVALDKRIESHILALRAGNEIEDEILLQRLLDVVDTRAELAITRELVDRNKARLRQAAGWSL